MRMNFQDALKETSEQIKIHLKDKPIEAISSLLTDVIDAPFAANDVWGWLRSKQLLESFFTHPVHGKKRSGHAILVSSFLVFYWNL